MTFRITQQVLLQDKSAVHPIIAGVLCWEKMGTPQAHLANRAIDTRYPVLRTPLPILRKTSLTPPLPPLANTRDTSTTIWGHTVPAPIGFAPIGINKIYHPHGELAVARAAAKLSLPYALSTAGSYPIESVGSANGPNGLRFFQLYMPHDDDLTRSLLQRAVNSGF
jgi:isopentenyl diphosphate isomerase/L-lactate dehydrogenase-like FMN-dependent dehydrogenase